MRFHYLTEQIYHRPWYITGSAWSAIHQTFSAALKRRGAFEAIADSVGGESDADILKRWDASGIKLSDMINAREPYRMDDTGIARVNVKGALARGLSNMERACGATGFEQIQGEIATAVEQGAKGILLKINSGGGTVNGTPETAQIIADTAQHTPIVVQSSDLIGSAAYYMAAGATRIFATKSAVVGSIGTLIPWVDFSEQMRAEGLVGDPIANREGDLKGGGWVTGRFTPAQRAEMQDRIQAMFEDFKGHVLTHRAVPAEAMRGQVLYGQAMLDANLIDEFGDEAAALAFLQSLTGVS